MQDFRRYQRQMLVPGVGPEGQDRIARAAARVGGVGPSYEVAARYATGAGFARVEPADAGAVPAPPFLSLPASRAVLAGSRAALAAIRKATSSP
jgi:hypothetical protein